MSERQAKRVRQACLNCRYSLIPAILQRDLLCLSLPFMFSLGITSVFAISGL